MEWWEIPMFAIVFTAMTAAGTWLKLKLGWINPPLGMTSTRGRYPEDGKKEAGSTER